MNNLSELAMKRSCVGRSPLASISRKIRSTSLLCRSQSMRNICFAISVRASTY
jgi:hypothetical protein